MLVGRKKLKSMRDFKETSELEQQILNMQLMKINSLNGLSPEDQIKLDKLLARKEELDNPTILATPDTTQTKSSYQQIEDRIRSNNQSNMLPVTSIQYIKCNKLNLLEYMKMTKHLNPWEREDRPCDTDLKNLLLYIDSELNNEVEKLKDVVKSVTSIFF